MSERYDDPITFYAHWLMLGASLWDLFATIADEVGRRFGGAQDWGDGWRDRADEFERIAVEFDRPLRDGDSDG